MINGIEIMEVIQIALHQARERCLAKVMVNMRNSEQKHLTRTYPSLLLYVVIPDVWWVLGLQLRKVKMFVLASKFTVGSLSTRAALPWNIPSEFHALYGFTRRSYGSGP